MVYTNQPKGFFSLMTVFKWYSNSKFSQNTTNLISIKGATCFDSRSHHQANYLTVFEVQQVKVHIFEIPKIFNFGIPKKMFTFT